MARLLAADRLAPIVAGVAGLAWFWAELTPQRTGLEDTDNPATGLAFLAAHPDAWRQAGLALVIAAIALMATVVVLRARLLSAASVAGTGREGGPRVGVETLAVVGFLAAAMLFGLGCVRLSGGPVLYVRGLDQAWGEMAYTVTQFVGTQLLLTGGLLALSIWIAGVAIAGVRRRAIPRLVAVLAIAPGIRLVALPGMPSFLPDDFWFVLVAAIPAAFMWLVVLGAWRPAPGADRLPAAAADPVAV